MNEAKLFARSGEKRVLFVGETIIDVYHYVRPLGRPLKESIVSVERINTERFNGGVIAAAEHAKDFARQVDIHSTGQPIRKERWVEASHIRKLFEVYDAEPDGFEAPMPHLDDYDVVIVTDYGHGMMDGRIDDLRAAPYLAVNVQTNSGNFGFNLATKYSQLRPDYLVVDEPEARLATQNRFGPIESSLEKLREDVAGKVVITLGKAGAVGIDSTGIHSGKAFVDRVVDTIGAGDAFFAVTALIAEEADMPTLLRIGNAAGAFKTGIVGHRGRVTKDGLFKTLGQLR